MPLIYITGHSGAGKSTVCRELERRGYEAHDIDENDISAWHNIESGERVRRPLVNRPADWYKLHAYYMSEESVKKLAEAAQDKIIFLCGIPANDLILARYYDKILCLVIDKKVMKQRIASRQTNNFGKSADELNHMLYWHDKVLKRYKNAGATMIDASQPLPIVIDEILSNVS